MEREVLEFDVQFVGAGPAGLAGAIHLANLIARHDANVAAGAPGEPLGEVAIAVLEKGKRGRRARHLGRGARPARAATS